MLTPSELLLTPNKLLLTPDEMAITKASAKRSAMSKQSPYTKSVVKAGKTYPRQKQCAAKEVAHVAKLSVQSRKTPTKAARLEAKARARAWAKRELGKKKGGQSQLRLREPSVVASSRRVSASHTDVVVGQTKSEKTSKDMVNALDQIGKSDNQSIDDHISEVFYDALENFEEEETDIVVEDASDDDDEEISNLRSSIRNQMPTKCWMEPVGEVARSSENLSGFV